jgi:ParB family chromosome partitioning protein
MRRQWSRQGRCRWTSICSRRTTSSRAAPSTKDLSRNSRRSIQAKGIIQPILVRPSETGYRIIAGERRWRAAQRAGLMKVPVVVRDVPDDTAQQHLELALIENIQRENLNPMEESLGYQRLTEEFGMTQEQVAAAVGKDRSTVTNLLRLLRLPEEIRAELSAGTLSVGHSRALLSLPEAKDQRHVAREVISRGLSVRETEAMVKRLTAPDKPQKPSASERAPTFTRRRQRIGCVSLLGRKSPSAVAVAAGRLKFLSARRPNSIASTRSSRRRPDEAKNQGVCCSGAPFSVI